MHDLDTIKHINQNTAEYRKVQKRIQLQNELSNAKSNVARLERILAEGDKEL